MGLSNGLTSRKYYRVKAFTVIFKSEVVLSAFNFKTNFADEIQAQTGTTNSIGLIVGTDFYLSNWSTLRISLYSLQRAAFYFLIFFYLLLLLKKVLAL